MEDSKIVVLSINTRWWRYASNRNSVLLYATNSLLNLIKASPHVDILPIVNGKVHQLSTFTTLFTKLESFTKKVAKMEVAMKSWGKHLLNPSSSTYEF